MKNKSEKREIHGFFRMCQIVRLSCLASVLALVMVSPTIVHAAAKLSSTKLTMVIGQSKTIQVKGTKKSVAWSTSKKKVAVVKSGKITAKDSGKAVITAKVGSKTFKCTVTVKKPALSASAVSLKVGGTKTIKVKNIASGVKVTWSTSKSSVATVKNGKITAKKNGSAVITAKAAGKSFTCKVKVTGSNTVTYETKPYKYDGKTLFTIKVPKGWTMEVAGITSSTSNPEIKISHPKNKNLSMHFVMDSTMVKSKAGHEIWASLYPTNAFAITPYLVPVSGYASNGMDTAGAFMGLCNYDSKITAAKIIKKIGTMDNYGDSLLVSYKLSGKPYKSLFNAYVRNGNTYYYGMTDVGVADIVNACTLSAPAESFASWIDVLCTIQGSLTLKDAFVEKAEKEGASAYMTVAQYNSATKTHASTMLKKVKNYIK